MHVWSSKLRKGAGRGTESDIQPSEVEEEGEEEDDDEDED